MSLGSVIFLLLAGTGVIWLRGASDPWDVALATATALASGVPVWFAASEWRWRHQRRDVSLAAGVLTVADSGAGAVVRWSAPTSAFLGVVLRTATAEQPADVRELIELRHPVDDRTLLLYANAGNGLGQAVRERARQLARQFGVDAWVDDGAGLERLPAVG